MVNFFDKLYSLVIDKNKFFSIIKFYSFLRFSIRILANIIIPIYFFSTRKNKKYILSGSAKSSGRIIVSLTTFPVRINRVWLVVESILRQSHQPDKIILWLSKEQFTTLDMLPLNLLKLQDRGLDIRLCEKDLRSHKKYFYALQEYPDDYLITIDDDIFYSTDTICDLIKTNRMNLSSVICRYAFKMSYSEVKQLNKYSKWSQLYHFVPACNTTFFGSGGATLFPPNSLHSAVLDYDVFSLICFFADDVWLNAMARLNYTKVVKTERSNILLPVLNYKNITLCSVNVQSELNDKQINDVVEWCKDKYNIDPFKYDDIDIM